MNKKMIVMCGIPKSGKSTYVDEHFQEYSVVCADDIREAMGTDFDWRLENFVWAVHDVAIRAQMIRGRDLVIDATNTTKNTIERYHGWAKIYNYDFKIIIIRTNIETCWERNKNAEIPVPRHVIERMSTQFATLIDSGFLDRFNVDYI